MEGLNPNEMGPKDLGRNAEFAKEAHFVPYTMSSNRATTPRRALSNSMNFVEWLIPLESR